MNARDESALTVHIRLHGDAEDGVRLERLRELVKNAQTGCDRVVSACTTATAIRVRCASPFN